MATGIRNASSILSKMKYDPLKQQEQRRFEQQEQMSNVAVSQRDKFLGKQVAQEQTRLQELDKFGNELAMRKDKLEFNKKIQSRKEQLANKELGMKEDMFGHNKLFDYAEAIIGAVSIPVTYMNRRKSKELYKMEKAERDTDRMMFRSRMGNVPLPWEVGTGD